MQFDDKIVGFGLTFDDVLLIPRYSEITPDMVTLKTRLTRNLNINVPLMSAAMDTVTEHEMAIALAENGGVGVIHKNMSIEAQAAEIKMVKDTVVSQEEYPNAILDKNGKLLVGASIGIKAEKLERAKALAEAGVDFFILDSAHGNSKNVVEALKELKKNFPTIDIVAGNVATYEGAKRLAENGADAIKVGMGPGSICTTRVISGMGVPQITAIMDCSKACKEHNIPLIADGGIRYSGDIVKAIVAGADSVMLGAIFGATSEAPGNTVIINGKKYKQYRGMGSLAAMAQANGSSDRYFQDPHKKLVAEGVEALVPCKGSASDIIFELLGGLRSGMGYEGAKDLETLQKEAKFLRITSASLKESHPHDVTLEKESSNYWRP